MGSEMCIRDSPRPCVYLPNCRPFLLPLILLLNSMPHRNNEKGLSYFSPTFSQPPLHQQSTRQKDRRRSAMVKTDGDSIALSRHPRFCPSPRVSCSVSETVGSIQRRPISKTGWTVYMMVKGDGDCVVAFRFNQKIWTGLAINSIISPRSPLCFCAIQSIGSSTRSKVCLLYTSDAADE